jgi:hypothetical protein
VKLFMKCSELFCMILFAVQLKRLFGCKAFNKGQSIRVIGASKKVIGNTTLFSPGCFLDLRCCFQNFIPCSRLQFNIKNLYMVIPKYGLFSSIIASLA